MCRCDGPVCRKCNEMYYGCTCGCADRKKIPDAEPVSANDEQIAAESVTLRQELLSVEELYRAAPPIVKAAVVALLEFEHYSVDPIGFSLEYYQEDLPEVVRRAIAPWAGM